MNRLLLLYTGIIYFRFRFLRILLCIPPPPPQLMANPDGRYYGLWQAQRAWAADSSDVTTGDDNNNASLP